jgi:hypothetical protein
LPLLDEVDPGDRFLRLGIGPGAEVEAKPEPGGFRDLVISLPGDLAVGDPFLVIGKPPVADIFSVDDRDRLAAAVLVVDLVQPDQRAVGDEKLVSRSSRPVHGPVEDLEPGEWPADLDPLHPVRLLLAQDRAAKVDEAILDLEFHSPEGLLASGQFQKVYAFTGRG